MEFRRLFSYLCLRLYNMFRLEDVIQESVGIHQHRLGKLLADPDVDCPGTLGHPCELAQVWQDFPYMGTLFMYGETFRT